MNPLQPVKDLYRMVTMPLKAVFVVGVCALINHLTYAGTWWVKWVALGMGIATVVALARGLRALLVLALLWWVGRWLLRRYGPAARERFDAWAAGRRPGWTGTRQAMADVFGALQPGGPVVAPSGAGMPH